MRGCAYDEKDGDLWSMTTKAIESELLTAKEGRDRSGLTLKRFLPILFYALSGRRGRQWKERRPRTYEVRMRRKTKIWQGKKEV